MRKLIERIAFYIRYEMTEDVKSRIELGVLCGALRNIAHRFWCAWLWPVWLIPAGPAEG